MKAWKDCPKCWGTGLVGGFQKPCGQVPAVEPREPTQAEIAAMVDEYQREIRAQPDSSVELILAKVIVRWAIKMALEELCKKFQ